MAGALREVLASFGIEFDGKQLEKGDNLVEGMIGKLKKFGPALLEAFAVKEIGEFTYGLAEQAEQLELHAGALGISTDALQKWQFAANLSGVGADELQIALQKLQKNVVGASEGGGNLAAVFAKLHISTKNANGGFKDADELMTEVGGAIGALTDPTQQTALAMQVFGRAGARLLPFLKKGAAGIAEMKAEVDDLGGGFTEEFIEKSKEMVQDTKRLDFALLGLKVNAVGPLVDLMAELADGASKVVVKFSGWIKSSSATKAALVVLGVGGAAALLPLLLSIAPIVAGFLLLESAITGLAGGKSKLGDWVDSAFGPGSKEKVRAFFKSIHDDLQLAGDDAYAFRVKWLTAVGEIRDSKTGTFDASFWAPWKDAYYATIQAMSGGFGGFVSYVVGLIKGLGLQFEAVWDDIYGGTRLLIAKMQDSFNELWNSIGNGGNRAIGQLLSHIPGLRDIGQEVLAAPSSGEGDRETDNASKIRDENNARAYRRLKEAEAINAQLGLGDQNRDAKNVASAPLIGPPVAPTDIKQTYNTTINQNFKAGTSSDMKDAAADGAKAGIASGSNLLAAQASFKKQGS